MTFDEIKDEQNCASYWLQQAAQELDDRDPVDAVNDASALLIAAETKLAKLRRE